MEPVETNDNISELFFYDIAHFLGMRPMVATQLMAAIIQHHGTRMSNLKKVFTF